VLNFIIATTDPRCSRNFGYALILQAADKPLGKMYKKWGFAYFLGEEDKPQPNMFIALETIKKGAAEALS
jgi:hypothetical protein